MARSLFIAAAVMVAGTAYGQFGTDNRYSPTEVSALVDRVHEDLNHAYGVWHFSGSDRDRLNKAEKELREFAQKWSKGKFDKGDLDDAIEAIQHVLDDNKLPQESRDALSDDVGRLRRMREAYNHHEIG
jgi:hypothetical protein